MWMRLKRLPARCLRVARKTGRLLEKLEGLSWLRSHSSLSGWDSSRYWVRRTGSDICTRWPTGRHMALMRIKRYSAAPRGAAHLGGVVHIRPVWWNRRCRRRGAGPRWTWPGRNCPSNHRLRVGCCRTRSVGITRGVRGCLHLSCGNRLLPVQRGSLCSRCLGVCGGSMGCRCGGFDGATKPASCLLTPFDRVLAEY